MPDQPGQAVYTQLCNAGGGIEADLTIVHQSEDAFLVVTGSGFGVRDSNWIARQLPTGGSVTLREVTQDWSTINLCGPLARTVLQAVTDDDVSNEALPFLSARMIEVGHAEVLAVRIGYVGELGWELYVPQAYAGHVYDTLWEAGQPHGIANAGYRAVEACRLEKGYVYWSADIGPDVNPYEAGLGFCVALDKGEFTGRSALEDIRGQNRRRRLVTLALDGFVPLHGSEPVLRNGELLGAVTSAGYGYEVKHTIAFALLPSDVGLDTPLEVEAFGSTVKAKTTRRCLYDPAMARLKA